MSPAPWSAEEYEALRELAKTGKTAADVRTVINALFGNQRTRNAILGAAHRCGVKIGKPNRGVKLSAMKRKGKGKTPPHKTPRVLLKDPPPIERRRRPSMLAQLISGNLEPLFSQLVSRNAAKGPPWSVADMTGKTCKWIDGDPRADRPFACAELKVMGKPYCVGHCKRAWGPSHKGRMSV